MNLKNVDPRIGKILYPILDSYLARSIPKELAYERGGHLYSTSTQNFMYLFGNQLIVPTESYYIEGTDRLVSKTGFEDDYPGYTIRKVRNPSLLLLALEEPEGVGHVGIAKKYEEKYGNNVLDTTIAESGKVYMDSIHRTSYNMYPEPDQEVIDRLSDFLVRLDNSEDGYYPVYIGNYTEDLKVGHATALLLVREQGRISVYVYDPNPDPDPGADYLHGVISDILSKIDPSVEYRGLIRFPGECGISSPGLQRYIEDEVGMCTVFSFFWLFCVLYSKRKLGDAITIQELLPEVEPSVMSRYSPKEVEKIVISFFLEKSTEYMTLFPPDNRWIDPGRFTVSTTLSKFQNYNRMYRSGLEPYYPSQEDMLEVEGPSTRKDDGSPCESDEDCLSDYCASEGTQVLGARVCTPYPYDEPEPSLSHEAFGRAGLPHEAKGREEEKELISDSDLKELISDALSIRAPKRVREYDIEQDFLYLYNLTYPTRLEHSLEASLGRYNNLTYFWNLKLVSSDYSYPHSFEKQDIVAYDILGTEPISGYTLTIVGLRRNSEEGIPRLLGTVLLISSECRDTSGLVTTYMYIPASLRKKDGAGTVIADFMHLIDQKIPEIILVPINSSALQRWDSEISCAVFIYCLEYIYEAVDISSEDMCDVIPRIDPLMREVLKEDSDYGVEAILYEILNRSAESEEELEEEVKEVLSKYLS